MLLLSKKNQYQKMWYFIAVRKIYLSIPIIEFLTSNSDEVGTSNHLNILKIIKII